MEGVAWARFARIAFELWFYLGHCSPGRWSVLVGVSAAVYASVIPGVVWRRYQPWFGLLFVVMHSPALLLLSDPAAVSHPAMWAGLRLSLFGSACGLLGATIFFTYGLLPPSPVLCPAHAPACVRARVLCVQPRT